MTAPVFSSVYYNEPFEVRNKRTLEFDRSNDLDSHDGLQDSRLCQLECFAESTDSSKSESQLRGINGMESTILENKAAASNRVTRERSLLQCLEETL